MSEIHEKAYQIVFIIVFILTIISLFGSLYIVISYILRVYYHQKSREFIADYVWIMSLADIIFSLRIILTSSNVAINYNWQQNTSDGSCWFWGFMVQLSTAFSSSMSIIIAIGILLPTINYQSRHAIEKNRKYHILFVSGVVLISCIIPMTKYGFASIGNSPNLYKIHCWISDTKYYLSLYLPITIYIISCFILLGYILYLRMKSQQNNNNGINQLILYTIVFIIEWLPAVFTRWHNVITKESAHITIVSCMWIGYSLKGIGNYLAWIWYFRTNKNSDIEIAFLSSESMSVAKIDFGDVESNGRTFSRSMASVKSIDDTRSSHAKSIISTQG